MSNTTSNTIDSRNVINGEAIYKPSEIAEKYRMHPATVRKIFQDEKGTIRLGHPKRGLRRQYFSLLIPESVVVRVFGKMTVGAGA